eukprot:527134-Pyramimonas_sp.AAC.1
MVRYARCSQTDMCRNPLMLVSRDEIDDHDATRTDRIFCWAHRPSSTLTDFSERPLVPRATTPWHRTRGICAT